MNGEAGRTPLFTVEEVEKQTLAVNPYISVVEESIQIPSQTRAEEKEITRVNTSIIKSLDEIFPEQQYEKKLRKAKQILGPIAVEYSADQLRDLITEIQFLCDSWLDDFERKIFNGLTLSQLIHEKGGV